MADPTSLPPKLQVVSDTAMRLRRLERERERLRKVEVALDKMLAAYLKAKGRKPLAG